MATFELYRNSTIGVCLLESLNEMVSRETIDPDLAYKILIEFDKCLAEALKTQAKSPLTIKGHLLTYRNYENVWTFILQDAVFRSGEGQENVDVVKIVACDQNLLKH